MRREVQDEILERQGIYIPMTRVIMTSDESDETWWEEVTALGWVRMDHEKERTVERYGRWYVSYHCVVQKSMFTHLLCVLGILSSSTRRFSRTALDSSAPTDRRSLSSLAGV